MNNERKIEMHSFIQQGFISNDFSEMYSFKQQTCARYCAGTAGDTKMRQGEKCPQEVYNPVGEIRQGHRH